MQIEEQSNVVAMALSVHQYIEIPKGFFPTHDTGIVQGCFENLPFSDTSKRPRHCFSVKITIDTELSESGAGRHGPETDRADRKDN